MAMMNTSRFLCFLAFLCIVVQKGESQTEDCPAFALFMNQTATGREIELKKEWNVKIRHICITCQISEVNVTCPDLERSLVKVNTSVISKTADGNCQLLGGRDFDTDATFDFTYVWDKIDFQTLNFSTLCY